MSATGKPDIPVPPGYTALLPFNRDDFRGKGRAAAGNAAFASTLNSLYLTAVEFFQASRSYPIVFARDTQSGATLPVAITGLEKAQNLFVDDAGNWRADSYLPAYIRRWPFFTAQVVDDAERTLVCVDPAGLQDSDTPFIDANGEATGHWQETVRLIQEMENARRQTLELTAALAEHQLLEPFEAHAVASEGGRLRLAGMYRVSEEKLNALPDKTIRKMMKKGLLSRIYAHLISLENFQRLLNLRLEREQQKGQA
jgi:hypothetical protein